MVMKDMCHKIWLSPIIETFPECQFRFYKWYTFNTGSLLIFYHNLIFAL